MQQRLVDIGKWLEINGDAIYKTRKRQVASQMHGEQKLYFTTKTNAIYCIFDKWSESLNMDLLANEEVSNVGLLGWDGELEWRSVGQILSIQLPKIGPDEIPCQHAWALQIELKTQND